jgi:hypothetical protein
MTTHTTEAAAFGGLLATLRDLYAKAAGAAHTNALACDEIDESAAQFWRGARDASQAAQAVDADSRAALLRELSLNLDSMTKAKAVYAMGSLDWWYYVGQVSHMRTAVAWAKRV